MGEGACNACIIVYADQNPNMVAVLHLEISM